MSFRVIARRLALFVVEQLRNLLAPDRDPGDEPSLLPGQESPLDMKPERTQWDALLKLMHPDWQLEKGEVSVHRTIVCADADVARNLVRRIEKELAPSGYVPDTIDRIGNVLAVRLTTATVGRAMEQDLAAALVIDTCV